MRQYHPPPHPARVPILCLKSCTNHWKLKLQRRSKNYTLFTVTVLIVLCIRMSESMVVESQMEESIDPILIPTNSHKPVNNQTHIHQKIPSLLLNFWPACRHGTPRHRGSRAASAPSAAAARRWVRPPSLRGSRKSSVVWFWRVFGIVSMNFLGVLLDVLPSIVRIWQGLKHCLTDVSPVATFLFGSLLFSAGKSNLQIVWGLFPSMRIVPCK